MFFDTMTVVGLIVSSFAATNIDNFALLVGCFLSGRGRHKQILAGYLLGMLAVLVLAGVFGLLANLFSASYVGYLGVIPVALGLRGLYLLSRTSDETDLSHAGESLQVVPLSIAATQVANCVDTVMVFGPLFADSKRGVDLIMIVGFIAMIFVWFGMARLFESQVARFTILERYGHWVSPIVLIVVGLYILDNTSTDVLLGE
ncbi:MAG: cadmium resistance transporter [Deltaproteobacteria bacterium]|nr:cadmium resistance transporter [Deltaproteobacteria bacterium]